MWDLTTMQRLNQGKHGPKDDAQTKPETQALQYGHPKFHELLTQIGELHNKKNFDYAEGGEQGPLGNFKRIAAIASLYPASYAWHDQTGVALTYMLKQLDAALMMFTTGKASKTGENINERLRDVAIYALLAIILNDEGSKHE